MAKILDVVQSSLPEEAKITDACFEASNIVLYSENPEFVLDNKGAIKKAVDEVKKRIELRADPMLTMDQDEAKRVIEKLLPTESGKSNIIFDQQRSIVIIESEKPGVAIGKGAEIVHQIKAKTLWTPIVARIPTIRSQLLENIRQVLYENNDYRRKFLHKVGVKIYEGWSPEKKEQWVRATFLGAAREVGRSCILLQTPSSSVLLDVGLNAAAPEKYAFPHFDAPEFKLEQVDAVVIGHAHLDHIGALPYLFKFGYKGPVYMTAPTRDVGALLALDYISVGQKENKEGIFGVNEVRDMVKHTICLNYEEVSDITPDMRLTFYNAGHTLGSSLCHLNIGNGLHNLLYTSDFNFELTNLLPPAQTRFPRVESVIMESTYGTAKEPIVTRQEAEADFIKIIKEVALRGGKILMPVLGVGRSQEMILILERNMREGFIPKMPVYIQGMLWDVTAIHTAYPDLLNNNMKRQIFQQEYNPFTSDVFKKVGSLKEMKEVIDNAGPYIILATSGMLTGGASVTYFRALAENRKNAIVLTCYQGPGSLGRRLQEGEREIMFSEGRKQEMLKVNLDVHVIKGFSGHSDYKQLLNWVGRLDPQPKKIITVHGEQSRALELTSAIYKRYRVETICPRLLESIRLA